MLAKAWMGLENTICVFIGPRFASSIENKVAKPSLVVGFPPIMWVISHVMFGVHRGFSCCCCNIISSYLFKYVHYYIVSSSIRCVCVCVFC
jgi:hypothetical protein